MRGRWGTRRDDILHFNQASASQKTECGSLGSEGQLHVRAQGSLTGNGDAVDLKRTAAGEVFDPVLVLGKKDLNLMVPNGGMIDDEIAVGTFPQGDGQVLERFEGRPVLYGKRYFDAFDNRCVRLGGARRRL